MLRPIPATVLVALLVGCSLHAQEPAPKKTEKLPPPLFKADHFPGYRVHGIQGFTVIVSSETLKHNDDPQFKRSPLAVLELELGMISDLFPTRVLRQLRRVLIWVEWEETQVLSSGRPGAALAVYYGGHQASLLNKGKHPLKARNVTVLRMVSLTREHQPDRDSGRCVLLHEIAHAVHDQILTFKHPGVETAYKQAMERKLYDPKMYISTNPSEFFAESSCAYFNALEYHPRTRADLKKHDPVTFKLLEQIWGKQKQVAGSTPGADEFLDVTLDKLYWGKPLAGPPLDKTALQGKPALVFYWSARSTSSLSFLTRAVKWQAELGDHGLITVPIHLVGTMPAEGSEPARARGWTGTILQGPWTKESPVAQPGDFPLAIVFDHEGICLFKGKAFDAEEPVRMAVGRWVVQRADLEEVPDLLKPILEQMEKGKSTPAAALARIVPHTRSINPKLAEPARGLVKLLTEKGFETLQEAETLQKDDPVGAYLKVEPLPRLYKETPLAAKATELINRLKTNKAVATEVRARTTLLQQIEKIDRELSSKPGSFDPKSASFRKSNGLLLNQLQVLLSRMKKSFPETRALAEATVLGEKYGLTP
jgi:hypothetical protein